MLQIFSIEMEKKQTNPIESLKISFRQTEGTQKSKVCKDKQGYGLLKIVSMASISDIGIL